jgi:hypothetical protein
MTSTSARFIQPLFKREHTVALTGLITPNESMSTTGIITPKQESPETSDTIEVMASIPVSNHGLMVEHEQDEGYHTQVPDPKLRSDSRKCFTLDYSYLR